MFEGLNEKEAKAKILNMVSEYYDRYHKDEQSYESGQRVPYAARVYDEVEMRNVVDSSLEFWLTAGRYVKRFEKSLANFLNIKHCALVNSGSSANLLAFMSLTSSLLKERAIKRGDEVITIASGFPTTVAPIIQYGAIPVFIDVTIPQYNIDTSMLKEALTNKTKAVMIAHTLGNPFDLCTVSKFCKENNLWLIEDNCDALGSKYTIDGTKKYTGTIGDIGTSSFYPPHHMTMGEGGAVYTNDDLLNKIIRSLRDWGRDCTCDSGVDNSCGHRYDKQYGKLPLGYDHKYVYSHFGYNLKVTDMQAAIGCAQIDKLPLFMQKRKDNFKQLKNNLTSIIDHIILPEACVGSDPSWFGFMIMCKEHIDRNQLVQELEKKNIQTRMLFAGNLIKHPCFSELVENKDFRVIGMLENTEKIMNDVFWIGVYPGMKSGMIDYMSQQIINAVQKQL